MMEYEAQITEDPQVLHADFLNRGRFYQKGFAVYIQGLVNDLDFWSTPDGNEQRAQELSTDMRLYCSQMRSVYDRLVEEGLKESPDADLLLPIHAHIQELSLEVEKIILGQAGIKKALELLQAIFRGGYQFRLRLMTLQESLRSFPGYEQSCLSGIDILGKKWTSVL